MPLSVTNDEEQGTNHEHFFSFYWWVIFIVGSNLTLLGVFCKKAKDSERISAENAEKIIFSKNIIYRSLFPTILIFLMKFNYTNLA